MILFIYVNIIYTNNMNLLQFVEQIKNDDCVNTILNRYRQQSQKGYVYERLWDLVIKFGFWHPI